MSENEVAQKRIAVVSPKPRDVSEAVREAGGEPVEVAIPSGVPGWGVALQREWVSDALEIRLADEELDALIFSADADADLAGILVAAMRLGVPSVCNSLPDAPFAAAVAALGFTPLDGEDAAKVAVRLASGAGSPEEPGVMVDNFSLANAMRVALALGCGTETVTHIAAIGRQAGVVGFRRMMEVLVSEAVPLSFPEESWYRENGLFGVLDDLADELHDTQTVSGALKDFGQGAKSPPPGTGFWYTFIQAKSSRAEMICTVPDGVMEFSALCRVFDSEEEAISAAMDISGGRKSETVATEAGTEKRKSAPDEPRGADGSGEEETVQTEEKLLLVVRRCGSKGEPGARVLHELSRVIREESLEDAVGVLTDGLAPEGATGVWASGFSPEAASSGVIGRLEDGDLIKLDFEEGRILTSIPAKDLARRRLARPAAPTSPAYVARYARSARSTLDGGSFG